MKTFNILINLMLKIQFNIKVMIVPLFDMLIYILVADVSYEVITLRKNDDLQTTILLDG